ncbi:MAG: hypothetical protein JKY81_00990 [Colwellia sp.]|nr:hypothetical protein [Colwellia sp.]
MKIYNQNIQKAFYLQTLKIIPFAVLTCLAVNITKVQAGSHGHKLYIDCDHAKVGNDGTKSLIKVRFLSKSGKNLGSYRANGVKNKNCDGKLNLSRNVGPQIVLGKPLNQRWRKVIDVRLDGYAHSIIIETEGDDGFLIDALGLWIDGKASKYWGKDDAGAWCLSTDKKDANKGWKRILKKNACYTAIHFKKNKKGKSKYTKSYEPLM